MNTSQTIEEQVKALIPQMTSEIAEKIRERAFRDLEHSIAQTVSEEAKRFVIETVLPQVRDELVEHEAEIKAALLAGVKGTAEQIAKALVDKTAAKLASYEGDKLLRDVFGPMFRGY